MQNNHAYPHFSLFLSISFDFLSISSLLLLNLTPNTHQLQYGRIICVLARSLTSSSIHTISHDWMSPCCEMHSDLMPPAMMNHHTHDARIRNRIIPKHLYPRFRFQDFPSPSTFHSLQSSIIHTTYHTLWILHMMHHWK